MESVEKPVTFAICDLQLGLPAGTVRGWCDVSAGGDDSLPLAEGEGMVLVSQVREWAESMGFLSAAAAAPELQSGDLLNSPGSVLAGRLDFDRTMEPAAEPAVEVAGGLPSLDEPLPAAGLEYATIRVPIVRGSARKLATRIHQTYSLRASDLHIREAYGDILSGCIADDVRLQDGSKVDNFSAVYRYLGEQIAAISVGV